MYMNNIKSSNYHTQLKRYLDTLVTDVYKVTTTFPKEEIYGITSQLRRASLSIMLNYIEGYARLSKAHLKNFLEISYGSLKETKYLLYFSKKMKYIDDTEYRKLSKLCEDVGKMLWGILRKM